MTACSTHGGRRIGRRAARPVDERLETAGLGMADAPAMQARATDAERERGVDALLARDPHAARPEPEDGQIGLAAVPARAAGRRESPGRGSPGPPGTCGGGADDAGRHGSCSGARPSPHARMGRPPVSHEPRELHPSPRPSPPPRRPAASREPRRPSAGDLFPPARRPPARCHDGPGRRTTRRGEHGRGDRGRAAPPGGRPGSTISGRAPTALATTGVPAARASRTASPAASLTAGWTAARAPATSPASCPGGSAGA